MGESFTAAILPVVLLAFCIFITLLDIRTRLGKLVELTRWIGRMKEAELAQRHPDMEVVEPPTAVFEP